MKKLIIFLIVVIFPYFLTADAKIEFTKKVIDFGDVESGKIVDVVFEFENKGDTDLEIKRINSSCGCTVPSLEKKVYKPGEKGKIPVKFYSTGYYGKIVKIVTLVTNDLSSPYVRLRIMGNVKLKDFSDPVLEVEKIDFNEVQIGKIYNKEINLYNKGNLLLDIKEVSHGADVVVEFNKRFVQPNEFSKISIKYKPQKLGTNLSFIKIRTDSLKKPFLIIRVSSVVEEK